MVVAIRFARLCYIVWLNVLREKPDKKQGPGHLSRPPASVYIYYGSRGAVLIDEDADPASATWAETNLNLPAIQQHDASMTTSIPNPSKDEDKRKLLKTSGQIVKEEKMLRDMSPLRADRAAHPELYIMQGEGNRGQKIGHCAEAMTYLEYIVL